MGFYAPAQIIRDAREHNVTINPICINHSLWDNTLEPDGCGGHAVRLGLRQIKRVKEEDAIWIIASRGNGYSSIHDVWRRAIFSFGFWINYFTNWMVVLYVIHWS